MARGAEGICHHSVQKPYVRTRLAPPKSRRDDTLLTVGFSLRKQQGESAKSRRDDTLLTVNKAIYYI
jgi:hypothetical protein